MIAFSIKIISRPLTLLLLQISAVFGFATSTPVAKFHRGLNAELGRLCPFSAPRGHTFSTCPSRFPPWVFHWQIFIPDKHKVSAPKPQCPPSKSDPNYLPLKKFKSLEKIDFQHTNTTIILGLVNK